MEEEEHGIVIVGGGICGLATALALHRKGIKSLVLEKSPTLRAAGAAIGVYLNGWLALDQLGVGAELRSKAIPIFEVRDIWLDKNASVVTPCRKEALRCLKRSDLMETLANNLPENTVRYSCQVTAIVTDQKMSFPILHINNGSIIKTKVLIGCDGSNSLVARMLGLEAPKIFPHRSFRAFTNYPNSHKFDSCFLRIFDEGIVLGRVPINENLVHWFIGQTYFPTVPEQKRDPRNIKEMAVHLLGRFPPDIFDMVQQCDINSLSLTQIRYRSPFNLLLANYYKGTMTVAGDALHLMGPFLGQGGSASLEDSVVLARCLAPVFDDAASDEQIKSRAETALMKYQRERRLRILRLTLQSYLVGLIMLATSRLKKLVVLVVLLVFFGKPSSLNYSLFDCGQL